MGLTAEDYLQQLQELSPHGPAWPRSAEAVSTRILAALATELARVDARVDNLLEEADPRTATEMLDDWERLFCLPDECLAEASTVAERRARLVQKMVFHGGQSRQFFIEFLAALGYPGVTIDEFRPFRAYSKCNAPLNQNGWRHVWRVRVPQASTEIRFNAISRANEPLTRFGDPGLGCILAKYKPAHTVLLIAYGED